MNAAAVTPDFDADKYACAVLERCLPILQTGYLVGLHRRHIPAAELVLLIAIRNTRPPSLDVDSAHVAVGKSDEIFEMVRGAEDYRLVAPEFVACAPAALAARPDGRVPVVLMMCSFAWVVYADEDVLSQVPDAQWLAAQSEGVFRPRARTAAERPS